MKFTAVFPAALLAVAAFGATAALAADNPILARQQLMKDNGKASKAGAAMAKGETPFDLATAKKIFATFEASAEKMPSLFPPDSKTGEDTRAAPKIWEDTAGFKASIDKLGADSKAAQASVTDLDSFKTAFGAIGKECSSCHRDYRIKKD